MASGLAVAIVGATRGLGQAFVSQYASKSSNTVYATSRSSKTPSSPSGNNISWVTDIDLSKSSCGKDLASALKGKKLDMCIITAGIFPKEEFGEAKWDDEIMTYTLSAVAPVFIVQELVKNSILSSGSNVVLISSEAGSLGLRNDAGKIGPDNEGGGDYAHHGSKAALNMIGKQLSFDLIKKGIAVALVHPSFMRTDMTKGVGFDKFWDAGGALKPEESAKILANWLEKDFSMEKTGTLWAPRGTKDIGGWNDVMGKETASDNPVQLPW